ncbi:MAG: ferrous iron transport protein B [Bacteroidales bacterium]|nr:ferrous iron transport protein B [Bacteroidales bacterium]
MVAEQKILLNHEYTVSKITGRWGLRRRIQKLGIEPYTNLVFTKKISYNRYIFKIAGSKKRKTLPHAYLRFIELVDTNAPDAHIRIKESLQNISVSVFKSDNDKCIGLFDHKSLYDFNDYHFEIKYLPSVKSIYGDDYEHKRLRNSILTDFPDIFVGIIDAKNLQEDLFLVTQFMDMDAKIVLAIRNFDPNATGKDKIDIELLSKLTGIPIIPYYNDDADGEIAYKEKILQTIIRTHKNVVPYVRHVHVNYGRVIENSISHLIRHLKKAPGQDFSISPRYLAINLLEKDPIILKVHDPCKDCNKAKCISNKEISNLESLYNEHIFTILKNARKAYINGAIAEITNTRPEDITSRKIDSILTHRIWGIPIFLAFMTLTFYSTFELGKYPMAWLETGVEWLSGMIDNAMPQGFWKDLILNGAIDGVGGVLVFLPNIFILFFFIGVLESTGYMSRAAFLMDKYMHRIGLHGKSFIPMIMGFGCTVPAIMSTRILENRRDRILTMMIVPFMSCSARLPVYILMISAFFPEHPVLMLFGIYAFGIFLALIISRFFSKTILKQREAPYIMELLPYRKPTAKMLLSYTWNRGKEYLKKIGGVILIGSVIIWLLGYFPRNVEYTKDYDNLIKTAQTEEIAAAYELQKTAEHHQKSYIGKIGHFIEPAMKPLGFDWKMSVSILAGIAGKEITVSTMGVLYQADSEEDTGSLQNKLKAETYSSGDKAGEKVFDKVVALSFIMFILIYFPCIAVISAIWKESARLKWALFSAFYTTGVAWLVSFAVYQIGKLLL